MTRTRPRFRRIGATAILALAIAGTSADAAAPQESSQSRNFIEAIALVPEQQDAETRAVVEALAGSLVGTSRDATGIAHQWMRENVSALDARDAIGVAALYRAVWSGSREAELTCEVRETRLVPFAGQLRRETIRAIRAQEGVFSLAYADAARVADPSSAFERLATNRSDMTGPAEPRRPYNLILGQPPDLRRPLPVNQEAL